MKKKIIYAVLLALATLAFASTALAVNDIIEMTANPSNTSIILAWTKAVGTNNTVIRYRTDTFPTLPTDGVAAYNGTAFQCTVGNNSTGEHGVGDVITPLVPGQVYYFSAWGVIGASYSATAYNLAMSTLAVAIPSGGADTNDVILPTPTINAAMNQLPDNTQFNFEPFSSMMKYFNTSQGGFGMPENNLWELFAILGIVGGGMATYFRVRNFFVAFAVLFVLTCLGVGLHLVQGWLVGVEIVIGAGVWGIEHYLQ